jgi:hypothetical protein
MNTHSDATPAARFVGVGIGDYDHYPSPLPGAPDEVEQIAELLGSRGVRATIAEATTEPDLITELRHALRSEEADTQGQLVVLWAGHGDRTPDSSLRLVAEDTIQSSAPLLTADYIASVAVRAGAAQVLLIFDTCFSGSGTISALATADRWHSEQVGPPGKVWLGVLSSAMDWEKARDDLFGDRLLRLLREGPTDDYWKQRWSVHNAGIRGDDLMMALLEEWDDDAPHRPKAAQYGSAWTLLPNPLHDPDAPPRVLEHLLYAARGGEAEDETWYFTGRHAVVDRLVSWVRSGQPGLRVITGPAGCGKSAVLGLLVCLSNPEQRAALLQQRPLDYTDPGEGSVHAHVYARGLAHVQLVRQLDTQLSNAGILPMDRRGLRGGGELVDAVASSGARPVIMVDGLDEAGVEAWPIAAELLRPLARHALILVGTRELPPLDDGLPLVTRLQPAYSHVVHLLDEVDDAPAMAPELIANAIQDLPRHDDEGTFLLARAITAQLRAEPVETTQPGWQQQLSTSVEEAFDRDLDGLPPLTRGEEQLPGAGFDLLAALAWAHGAGLPDDIWPLIATTISPNSSRYGRDDAYWALTQAGRYVVEAGEFGHAVYRLSHQRLAEHLRARTVNRGVRDAELRIATTLVSTYHELLDERVNPADHPYLWRYTWRHCADAGPPGITALRRLVDLNPAAFLPDLALASQYLAARHVEAGNPLQAVRPAEDAVALFRQLATDNPGYLPDLAMALNNLGVRYGEVGRRTDAVYPAEEAVTLFRQLATDNSAYLPDLAMALYNLGVRYGEVGRRTDAVYPPKEAVTLFRQLATDNPAYLPDLATALTDLGVRYSEVGRRTDAVYPAEEAVTLFRRLATDNPGYLPNLAGALGNLGTSYSQVGRPADAVQPSKDAVTLFRQLATDNPAHLPDLAMALNNLGESYSQVGRRTDAVYPAEEAVTLYRQLAADNPAAFWPNLAMALNNLGIRYIQVGRRADALAPAEEAITLRRELAVDNPGFLPDLATALNNLGLSYSQVGRRTDAVQPAEEAVTLYRQLAADNPAAFLPDLATALNNLGTCYGQGGRPADAVQPIEEAVTLRRQLAAGNPAAFLPDLAGALNNLGTCYGQVGRPADAVQPIEEAVTLRRRLAAGNPAAFLPDLAGTLVNLGIRYSEVGRRTDAVQPAEEAVTLYRQLAADNPAYLPNLSGALNNVGNRYSEVGRRTDAVQPTEEAVTLYRQLAADNPAAFRPDLANALNNLGNRYSEVGHHADAVQPAEEAVTLRRQLAADNPAAFLPDLAGALNNLGNRYSGVGRPADAVDPTEKAATAYRELAADNPAFLPGLALALNNLGERRQEAGLSWDADAAWTRELDRMPTSDLKAGLLLAKSRYSTPDQAIADVLGAIALAPSRSGSTLFDLRSACRKLRRDDHDRFDRKWQQRFGTQQPPWLHISDGTLTTVSEWLSTPTHTEARDYHRDHAEPLARPEARVALDELALLGTDSNLIDQYRQLLIAATGQGIDQAYQPLILQEALETWLHADIPEQLRRLSDNRELLLSNDATTLLDQWSTAYPDDISLRFGKAMLTLAREDLDSEVLAAAGQPEQLNALLAGLRGGGKPQLLLATSELLLCLNLDEQVLANAQLHHAIALALTGHTDQASEDAHTAARLDPNSVNRWIADLATLATTHPELATLIHALATAPPDAPDDTTSTSPPT